MRIEESFPLGIDASYLDSTCFISTTDPIDEEGSLSYFNEEAFPLLLFLEGMDRIAVVESDRGLFASPASSFSFAFKNLASASAFIQ
jgi:hypothetical protein